ncbi:MAG: PHP domain-containing protein [Planctomycetota bacterium]|nr:MAG: PHP domain-containing protein [Planctomycetota bacterium]
MSRIDLHTHTRCSDGTLSPEALLALAAERGVRTLAITDHDTVAAHPLAAPHAAAHGIELIAGVEIGCAHNGGEIHLLGYLFDPTAPRLAALLQRTVRERRERFEAMLARLAERGLGVDARALLAEPDVALGRGQLGRLLVEQGLVRSIGEVFRRLLGEGQPCYVPKPLPSSAEAIATVREAGGVAVLAHPGRYARKPDIAALVAEGLGGIEVYYPSHEPDEVRHYLEACARHDLVPTGGSDFHGDPGRPELGSQPVPTSTVERLRARCRR